MRWKGALSPFAGVFLGALYGLFARWITHDARSANGPASYALVGVSIAFLLLVPYALGVLSASMAPPGMRGPWLYWIFMPMVSVVLMFTAAAALAWEGAICILIASPIMLGMAMLGGITVGIAVTLRRQRLPRTAVASCLVLPFAFGPAEPYLPQGDHVRVVTTVVDIDAPPAVVWRNVVRVPLIAPEEQTVGLFQRVGIPQPLEATLDREGPGGLREARFAGGLRFHERVTEWEEEKVLGFTIAVDAASIRDDVLDLHVRVGGPYFDVTHGRFRLDPRGGGTRLTLESRHRLRTRLNAYAGFWTEAVMSDIQTNICRVIRHRAEGAR